MRQNLAVLVDGVLHLPNGECSRADNVSTAVTKTNDDNPHIDVPMDAIDEIPHLLARVVALTQTLSEQDARRAREFIRIAHAAMTVSTCLPPNDQQIFQDALRQQARR